MVLHLAHDVPMASYLGITKTKNCILQHYFWPGIFTDPKPRVETMFESMGTTSIVSTSLDLAKGYWLISMAADSREKTAFATPFGLYDFEVMPFGLHNAPATFQKTMKPCAT